MPRAAALLAGARHVQLWHGVSIKEIGLRNLAPLKHMSARYARVLATCGPFATLVGTAAAAEAEWRRCLAQQPGSAQVSAYLGMLERRRGGE
jgi:hypothetical protein